MTANGTSALPSLVDEGEHCQDCGRAYDLVWAAENDLWNEVVGGSMGLLCPDCFDLRCRGRGIYPFFVCHREHIPFPPGNDHALWRQTGHDGVESEGYFEPCILPRDHEGPCRGTEGSSWTFRGSYDEVHETGRR